MDCDFCYNYFDGAEFQPELCLRVIDRCLKLGARVFTIGGAEPFIHKEIWTILEYLRSRHVFIHVDTNGLCLNKAKLQRLNPLVDLLALPLDGSNRHVHEAVRKHPSHFNMIKELLEELSSGNYSYRVKVNTLAVRSNLNDLENIGSFLEQYKVHIWSIYEFWPLQRAEKVLEKYRPEEGLIDRVFAELKRQQFINHMHLELHRYIRRYQTYFFITPQGKIYIHDFDNPMKYKILGDIFDQSTAYKINGLKVGNIREDLRERYKNYIQ